MIKEIHSIDANIKVIFVDLDLSDQVSIRKAAETVLNSGAAEKIDALINNAGVMATPYSTTKQGIELQFGTVRAPGCVRETGLIAYGNRITLGTFYGRICSFQES